jgi:mannose-6-phosphate isomerase-like protein (cupin superfamily)
MPNDLYTIPPDDLTRQLTHSQPDALPHLAMVGNTYTITVSGAQTGGRFCVIDMHVAPGGGPPPHRHDFEETFILQEGELEMTFRGQKMTLRAGETLNIPSNAPHQFKNVSGVPARTICVCVPAGLDEFFWEVGAPVATRTTPAPEMSEAELLLAKEKAMVLARKYKTEMLREA